MTVARASARALARALTALTASSSAASAPLARARASSRAVDRSLGVRDFIAASRATHRAYGVTDEQAFGVDPVDVAATNADDASRANAREGPTKRKNHIKRMKQREAFRRSNAKTHKENERRNAIERQEKRLARWRAGVAMKREYEMKYGGGLGETTARGE